MTSLCMRAAALALGSALCVAPASADVLDATISVGNDHPLSQPTLETGQNFTFTVEAPAGTVAFLLLDFAEGTTRHPGLGTVDIPFSPLSAIFYLGVVPEDGLFLRFDSVDCMTGFDFISSYFQVVGRIPATGDLVKSNLVTVDVVEGDCDQDCEGGIALLGVQTQIAGVAAGPGTLSIVVKDKDADGDVLMSFSEVVDPSGDGPLPIFNATGSVEVEALSVGVDGALTVRLEVDAVLGGLNHGEFTNNTWFEIGFGGQVLAHGFHTSCSQPISVGMVFGPFTVTNLIDVGPGGGMGM